MKLGVKKTLPIGAPLLLGGAFLEVYFYYFRFAPEMDFWLAAGVASFCAMWLLTVASWYYKKPIAWFVIVPLAVFSVICTSAGQSISYAEKYNENIIVIDESTEVVDQIKDLETELKKQQDLFDNAVAILNNYTPKEKMNADWKFKTRILDPAENSKAKAEAEKIRLSALIEEKRSTKTQAVAVERYEKEDIYSFYNDLVGSSRKWTRFILQSFLSLIIAIMAPIGINLCFEITIGSDPVVVNKKEKVKVDPSIKEDVERWVAVSYHGFKNGKTESIIEKGTVLKFFNDGNRKYMSPELYDKIYNAAKKAKVIDIADRLLYTKESEAVKAILREVTNGK